MAETTGLVQGLFIGVDQSGTCVFIGPDQANMELLLVRYDSTDTPSSVAWKTDIAGALMTAMETQQQVKVGHGDTDPYIIGLSLPPTFSI